MAFEWRPRLVWQRPARDVFGAVAVCAGLIPTVSGLLRCARSDSLTCQYLASSC
jgi:hypothetical protein